MRRTPRHVFIRRRVIAIGGALLLGVLVGWPALKGTVRDLTLPLRHADINRQQARSKHLDPALIAAVIYAESKFNPRPSPAGAEGLMQILPATARFIAHRTGGTAFTSDDLATPQVNISYGSYYLRYLLDRYDGNETLALAAYNGGEANVDGWLARARANGERLTADRIPFPETRAYVAKVERKQREYSDNYASQLGL
jgi:soluble lytic murein transglycosylase